MMLLFFMTPRPFPSTREMAKHKTLALARISGPFRLKHRAKWRFTPFFFKNRVKKLDQRVTALLITATAGERLSP